MILGDAFGHLAMVAFDDSKMCLNLIPLGKVRFYCSCDDDSLSLNPPHRRHHQCVSRTYAHKYFTSVSTTETHN